MEPLDPQPFTDATNRKRATRAAEVLTLYAQVMTDNGFFDSGDTTEHHLRSLLTDLLHLIRLRELDIETLLRYAITMHEEESVSDWDTPN